MSKLRREIESAINRCSAENQSDTPDFILAEFLIDSLRAFDKAVITREGFYGRKLSCVPPSDTEANK